MGMKFKKKFEPKMTNISPRRMRAMTMAVFTGACLSGSIGNSNPKRGAVFSHLLARSRRAQRIRVCFIVCAILRTRPELFGERRKSQPSRTRVEWCEQSDETRLPPQVCANLSRIMSAKSLRLASDDSITLRKSSQLIASNSTSVLARIEALRRASVRSPISPK